MSYQLRRSRGTLDSPAPAVCEFWARTEITAPTKTTTAVTAPASATNWPIEPRPEIGTYWPRNTTIATSAEITNTAPERITAADSTGATLRFRWRRIRPKGSGRLIVCWTLSLVGNADPVDRPGDGGTGH